MRTKDIATADASNWHSEPNEMLRRAFGKLAEEASELSQRCARVLIHGAKSIDPDSKRSNVEEVQDEIADVTACMNLLRVALIAANSLDSSIPKLDGDAVEHRTSAKMNYKRRWILGDNPFVS